MPVILNEKQIRELLALENQRAELMGEVERLQQQVKALDNAIWRLTAFAQELAKQPYPPLEP
jgi:hypothetical protein